MTVKSHLVGRKASSWEEKASSNQVVTTECCGLVVISCGFISLLIGRETINIPEIFSGVHSFTGMTVNLFRQHCSDKMLTYM